jgi:acyl-CoA synthetase (NDP forming)
MTESRLPRYDLDVLVAPRSVALYGVSERTSAAMASNLKAGGRPLIGVHPVHDEVLGIRCVRRLADSGEQPDMVVMGVGHARIEDAVDDVIAAGGARVVIVPGLGAESGDKGASIAARIGAKLSAAGIAMLGANCMGVATPEAPSPWIGWVPPTFLPGGVAAVVQSGSLGSVLVGMGPRTGFRTVISTGAEETVDVADALAFLAADERTRVAGLFIEGVRRPAEFEEGLRRMAEAGKPVVVLKVGTSAVAARAALAHTGALVGSDRAFSAVLRHYGAIRVDDSSSWVEHLVAFGANRTPRGTRIGAITASGGEGEHIADTAERIGHPLSDPSPALAARLRERFPNFGHIANPVDGWAIDAADVVFPAIVDELAASGEYDALLSVADHTHWAHGPINDHYAGILHHLVAHAEAGLYPCAISVTTAEPSETDLRYAYGHDLPLLRGVGAGVAALTARLAFRPVVPPPRAMPAGEPIPGSGALPEIDSAAILAAHGIPSARAIRCTSPAAAAEAATRIGFPVVVKVDGPAHKARVDGVAVGLADEAGVAAAAIRMGGRVIVAEQVRGGVEALLGAIRDPGHGAVVAAGVGGGAAEALDLAATALAPLDLAGAERLLRAVPALVRLVGEPLPTALLQAIVALGDLAASHPEIAEIDVNPLLVRRDTVVALDALIVLGGTP